MANKVTIDVEARFIDNVSDGAQDAASSIKDIGDEAEKARKKTDKLDKEKVNPKVDADTDKFVKKMKEAEERAKKFGKTKTDKVIGAQDKASSVINKIINKSKSIAGKVWSAAVKVKDSNALAALKNIGHMAKGIAGKTWTAIVKVKDFALSPLNRIKNSLFSIKTLIGTIFAGIAAKKFVLDPINLADAYSSAQIGFSTLLGKERGQQMMNDLDAFAKATPFKSAEVIAQTQRMLAMGWNAEDIIKDMTTIGDAAAATGKGEQGLQQIVTALAQIKSKGRLSTEELNQLAEAGISAKRYIAEGLGYGSGDEGIAAMTADLEKGAISSGKALEALIEGMKEYSGMMETTANETVEGLWSQIQDTFEINIFRRWGQGLQDGAKEGFGTILDLLNTSEGALEDFGDTVYKVGRTISQWLADKLKDTVARIKEITGSDAFKNATLGGKVKMLWDGVIANPFSEWWSNTVVPWWDGVAVPWMTKKARSLGETIGKGLSNGLLALLGVDVVGAAEQGASIAGSFVKGFTDGFDGSAVADAFVDAFGRIWDAMPWWAKALLFGYGASKVGSMIGNLVGGLTSISGMMGSANQMTGLLGFGTKAAIAMGGGNLAGGASLGAGSLSALGLAGTGGLVYGGATAISGAVDLYNGYKNNDATAKKAGWWKIGGAGGGAALGAAIGSVIPGVGTLLGAGIGALGGSLFGNWGANKAKEEAERLANAEKKAAEEAAKLKAKMKELAKADMAKHFGDITLSAEEVKTAVNSMIGQELIDRAYASSEAISQMDASLKAFNSTNSSLKKELWLVGVKKEAKLTDDEIKSLNSSAETFSASAKTYLEDAQYASSESIAALMGNSEEAEKILEKSTAYYDKQKGELSSLSDKLSDELEKALSDNVISIDEQKSIDTIRTQIANVMNQIQKDEYQASINVIKAKYGDSDIDVDSYKSMMDQMHKTSTEMTEGFWDQFGRGSIGLEEGSEEWNALMKSTLDNISGTWENAGDLGMDKLQDKWASELGLLGEDFSSIMQNNTGPEIMSAVNALSDDTRASIGEMLEIMKPTTEQIQSVADSYRDMGLEVPEALQSYLDTAEFYEALAKGPEAVENFFLDKEIDIDPKMRINSAAIDEVINETGTDESVYRVAIDGYADVEWEYDEFDNEWIRPDGKISFTTEALLHAGWTYNEFEKKWISPDERYSFKTTAYVDVNYKISGGLTSLGNPQMSYGAKQRILMEARGGIVGGTSSYPGFADGGMVRGGARIVKVAEEGTPEMIIPLGSQRRERGRKLWAKAGEMLRVPGFARGGLSTGSQDEGLRFRNYGSGESAGGQAVQIEVGGITVEIHVDARGTENIAEAIQAQKEEIAETVAGILADAFTGQFENMPVRGGVA